ncbi:hypothetical protein GIB67_021548 [Kingdonia uniflora]|uniref:RNase H type-1 domain-containing protein n=1 Tax=Kingdonia uniflora TaxID=39325 RepID=A0A7J7L9W9_9MAGN|nr:hypothetical protein GIB67_021548 [Kingdonia uniflora]
MLGDVVAAMVKILQSTTFYAEYVTIIKGLKQAQQMGITNVWVTSDSEAAVKAFNGNKIPWQLTPTWQQLKKVFYYTKDLTCVEGDQLPC